MDHMYRTMIRVCTVKIRSLSYGPKISEIKENTRFLLGFISYFSPFRSFSSIFDSSKFKILESFDSSPSDEDLGCGLVQSWRIEI